MSTAQASVQQTAADRALANMDDDLAAIVRQSGYYDPDSAAYAEDDSVSVTVRVSATEEGLPVRELVTA